MKKQLVLIVDDVDKNLQLIAKMIEPLDLNISFSTSAKNTLSLLKTIKPDLIILDIIMPEMNGFELCEIIKSKYELKKIPILFLSAKNSPEDIVKGFKLGASDYLTKPFIKDELLARISTQLTIKKNADALRALNRNLEKVVSERTGQLKETNKKLSDYNSALRVLLEQREADKKEFQNLVIENTNELVLPLINKLKDTKLNLHQLTLINTLEHNLRSIIKPFMINLKSALKSCSFTQREIEIATLIKMGFTSDQIAAKLNTSLSTISFHRNKMRKKLSITNRKVNLELYLKSLE